VANPGTWRVLVDGSVTREWAKHHHPNWFKKLVEQEGGRKENRAGGEGSDST
jgi:cytochrome b subunit of formate dehydrogenase